LQTLPGGIVVLAGGQHDDGHVRPAAPQLAHQPDASLAGHPQIGDDDRGESLFELFECLFGTGGRLTLVVPGASGPHENVAHHRLVVHDGYSPCGPIFADWHGPTLAFAPDGLSMRARKCANQPAQGPPCAGCRERRPTKTVVSDSTLAHKQWLSKQ